MRAASIVAAVMLLLAPGATVAQDLAALEADAVNALVREQEPFPARAALVERLRLGSNSGAGAEQRGRLALLWLRGMRWLLDAVPFGASERPPFREWLDAHRTQVVYSEPAGQWLLNPEVVWSVHSAHRRSASADDIAWLAVENGYPGECEGYIPCYANILNWLDGEYLRRHPRGRHAADAVAAVRTSLGSALDLLSGRSANDFLNPATDCGDLKSGLVPLRRAVADAGRTGGVPAVATIDRLLAYCP